MIICFPFKRRRWVNGRLHESKHWFGALRLEWETGLPRKWSLGVTDKREAERLLHAERIKAEKRHHGLLPPEELTDAAQRPLNELLEAFLGELRTTKRRETTIKKYREMKVLFARCKWQRFGDVTDRSYCDWRKGSSLKGKTLNDGLKNTCNFFDWMKRKRMVAGNPLEYVEPVQYEAKQFRRALTSEQAQKLLSVAARSRAVVYLIAMQTGLRRHELQTLTVGDLVLDTPTPTLRVQASMSKNRKEAFMRLRPEVVAAIRTILPDNPMPYERLLPGMVPRLPRFKKDLALAGIPFEDAEGRRLDLHALRTTLGANLFAAGTSPYVIKELMRHSDIRTTLKHYSDASQLPLASAIANLPALSVPEVEAILNRGV